VPRAARLAAGATGTRRLSFGSFKTKTAPDEIPSPRKERETGRNVLASSSEEKRFPREKPIWYLGQPNLPLSAVALAFATLLVPVLATLFLPQQRYDYEVMLWLLSLLPAFLLAFYRGWRGVATALGIGMGALVLVQVILLVSGRHLGNWPLLVGVTIAYLGIALAVGFLSEMLHRERMRAEKLALTDELTDLPNRRYLRLFLDTEFAAARRGRSLVVVFFDLDRFKQYNDRYGHNAGDDALKTFGTVLRTQTRTMNLSGRYGGEEFVSVLSSCEIPGALIFVERIKKNLRETPLKVGALTVSAGVAAYHPSMRSPDDLLAAADEALYDAKRHSVDFVRVYEQPIEAETS
jgi:diguanylate cyclase (GGDEF)-like protein